ncbi:MAG: helix-turn-helix domain-containing protein [Candidatus Brocadiia bacterium]
MKYVHDLSEAERGELNRTLKSWQKAKEVRRVRAIWLSGKDWSVPEIAEVIDVQRDTIRKWIDWYEKEGLEGLRTASRSGRPPKADEHYRELLGQTVQTPPRELNYDFNRWTLQLLARHMEEKTGVSLHHR